MILKVTDGNCEKSLIIWSIKKRFHEYGDVGVIPGGIFSHIRRLGHFFLVQNSEFQYYLGFSEK